MSTFYTREISRKQAHGYILNTLIRKYKQENTIHARKWIQLKGLVPPNVRDAKELITNKAKEEEEKPQIIMLSKINKCKEVLLHNSIYIQLRK